MGVLKLGDDADLLKEPLGSDGLGELLLQDLDGHRTIVLHVPGAEYRGHSAAPDLVLDAVAVSKGRAQVVDEAHGPRLGWEPRGNLRPHP